MRKSCNHILALLNSTALIILILSSCTTDEEAEIRELHRQYMDASMNHDIEILSAMTAEDIVWHLEQYTLEGREEALGPDEYDAGLNNRIEYSNVVVRGDTVDFELVENNEIVETFGMDSVRHFPRFIIENGLLHKKELWKPSTDFQELNRRRRPFHQWVNTTHPEAMKEFFNSEGNFVFSRETGQLYVQLLRQWREEESKKTGETINENP